ncbi:MAG: hypothetical protein ABR586_08215 [Thermoplasmatota archaeon]
MPAQVPQRVVELLARRNQLEVRLAELDRWYPELRMGLASAVTERVRGEQELLRQTLGEVEQELLRFTQG